MGINAFKKGHREKPKKTAKALESDIVSLEGRMRNVVMMLQMQMQQMNQRLVTVEQQAELIDFRSLATLKLSVAKGLFTNEEHDAMAELTRIDSFNDQSDRDTTARGLVPAADGTGLDKDLVYIARVDAFEPAVLVTPAVEATKDAPGTEAVIAPNPNAGKKIDQLSMLRMKVTFGSGEFPGVFEANFKGAKVGETISFTLECPKELGAFAGKTADFQVNVLQILETPKPVQDTASADDGPDRESEGEATPALSVVEEPQ